MSFKPILRIEPEVSESPDQARWIPLVMFQVEKQPGSW
jgi:hypothetical protein